MRNWRKYHKDKALRSERAELAGKNLACWCPLDQPCHADVLLRVANNVLCVALTHRKGAP